MDLTPAAVSRIRQLAGDVPTLFDGLLMPRRPLWIDRRELAVRPSQIRGTDGTHLFCVTGGINNAYQVLTQNHKLVSATRPAGQTTTNFVWKTSGGGVLVQGQEAGTGRYLVRSANGISGNYATVLTWTQAVGQGSLHRSLVDLGSGKLLFFQYGVTGSANSVWYSVDDGVNWGDPLFVAAANSITHFHGGVYDSASGRLYVLTGDNVDENSILICDNVADLVANPATWSARWGLDDATRSTFNPAYAINDDIVAGVPSTGKFRTVDVLVDGNNVFFGTDGSQAGSDNYCKIWRYSRLTGLTVQVGTSRAIGNAWQWLKTSDGHRLFFNSSEYAGSYSQGHDHTVRLYALSADLMTYEVLKSWRRTDYVTPAGSITPQNVHEVEGIVYITWNGTVGPLYEKSTAGQVRTLDKLLARQDEEIYPTMLARPQPPSLNLLKKGDFSPTNVSPWAVGATCTLARETTIVEGPNAASLKLTPDGSVTAAYAKQVLATILDLKLVGEHIVLAVRVLMPAARNGGQTPKVDITGSGVTVCSWTAVAADFDGLWREVVIAGVARPVKGGLGLQVNLYGHAGASNAAAIDPVYFSDARLTAGIMPGVSRLVGLDTITA